MGDADPIQPERGVRRRRIGLERSIRWLFMVSFSLVAIALIVVSDLRGIDRGDTFEIIVITIVWLTLIIGAALTVVAFRRAATR